MSLKKRSGVWDGTQIFPVMARQWSSYIALVITCVRLKDTEYEPQRLGELADAMISQDEIRSAAGHVVATLQRRGKKLRNSLGVEDERAILEELKANGCAPLVPAPLDVPPEHSNKMRRARAARSKKQEKRLARLARTSSPGKHSCEYRAACSSSNSSSLRQCGIAPRADKVDVCSSREVKGQLWRDSDSA